MARKCSLLMVLLAGLLVVSPVLGQSRSVFWNRWDVTINNIDARQNVFDVTESYDISFTGTFTFGSAVIPQTNLESINNVSVQEAGRALSPSCSGSAGTFCAENTADGLSITYYFRRPITDDQQQFTLRYTVVGALRIYEDGDQLWWTAIPPEHFGFPIASSTVTVELPAGYAPREGIDLVETYGAPGDVSVRGTTVVATATRQLTGDESFEIRVQFPHNPQARVPGWQSTFDGERAYQENTLPIVNVGILALTCLLGLGGVVALFALWYVKGRDPLVGPVPEYLTEPPDDLRPAAAGALIDEQAEMREVVSIIVDLAERGYIVMEEHQTEGILGLGKQSSFIFKRTDKPADDLLSFEKRMIEAVFRGGLERSLDSLKNTFYVTVPSLQGDVYAQLLQKGFFSASPEATRTLYQGISTLLFGAAFLVFFFTIEQLDQISYALALIPVSLSAVGVATFIIGQHMPAKTRQGAESAAKWRAFREYLNNLDKYRAVEEATDQFATYLPYAIAFGIDQGWIRRFSGIQNVPIPIWYYPTYLGPYHRGYTAGTPLPRPQFDLGGGRGLPGELARAEGGGFSLDTMSKNMAGGLENISTGLTQMLDSAGRALNSQPQQSGSSGRWSSGGRSWSGGGFRGGGSSGGGSRGFG